VKFVAHGSGMQPSKTPLTAPHAASVRRALTAAHGVEPLIYPAGFGSLPGYAFTRILGIEAFVTPYGNHDEANHAPNENLTLDCFHNGIRTGAALLSELARAR
jgi:acetylornithine deacetylase/succinyl-diaminopimelate desuccinylase-like protein